MNTITHRNVHLQWSFLNSDLVQATYHSRNALRRHLSVSLAITFLAYMPFEMYHFERRDHCDRKKLLSSWYFKICLKNLPLEECSSYQIEGIKCSIHTKKQAHPHWTPSICMERKISGLTTNSCIIIGMQKS